ncbi:MAG: hypothetical protein WAU39_18570 [Polyangiales bacterium]
MPRALFVLVLPVTPALLVGCSDLGSASCVQGQSLVDGACVGSATGGTGGSIRFPDPEEQTKGLRLGCANNLTYDIATNLVWDLTVNPGPIVSGEPFGAEFRGVATFGESFLDGAQQAVSGGVHRIGLVELKATVHARKGIVDTPDAVLHHVPIEATCAYDDRGMSGLAAGPFPACDPSRDNLDGSNEDCTGLGGEPRPENRCAQFVNIPTSTDCLPGGNCDLLGKLDSQCEPNGFCATGPLDLLLEGSREVYIAATEGEVLFGWDDASTSAEIDQSGGPNHGTWIIPPPAFDDPVGPIGLRARVGDLEIALECIMGIDCRGPYGTNCRDSLPSPTPDIALIRFPIYVP